MFIFVQQKLCVGRLHQYKSNRVLDKMVMMLIRHVFIFMIAGISVSDWHIYKLYNSMILKREQM